MGQIPTKIMVTGDHDNKDTFDIGLEGEATKDSIGSREFNTEAFEFFASTNMDNAEDSGLKWAIQNGYEIHVEYPKGTKAQKLGKDAGDYHFFMYPMEATDPNVNTLHLHIQRVQDEKVTVGGQAAILNYDTTHNHYTLTGADGKLLDKPFDSGVLWRMLTVGDLKRL